MPPFSAVVVFALSGCWRDQVPFFDDSATPGPCSATRTEEVGCVVDGDTLDVNSCGGERVRLLGVDTPEVHGVDEPECYGPEASDFLKDLLPEGAALTLRFDIDCVDTYDRTLAYVYIDDPDSSDTGATDELFVNELILSQGYGRWFAEDIGNAQDIREKDRLQAAEDEARSAGRGLWGACE
jgi:micrococcal nuclease